jgi:peptide/nickel transport system substrate-binding protein
MGIVPEGTGPSASRRPVGSGPYRLAEFVPDDHVTLDPFPQYIGGAPRNAGLLFRTVPDETMRGLELRKGSVDLVINDLSPDMVHSLEEQGGLAVTQGPGTDYAYIGFNLRDPLLADVRVRRAIGFAIDRQSIVQYLRRGLARETPGIVPSMSWAFAGDVFTFTHDPAQARAILDDAGYRDPDGPGPAMRLHLTLKTSTDERYRLQAAVIQQQLAEVGIALDVRSYEFATLMSDVIRGNVQLYTLQYVGVTDPDMLRRAFHSSQVPPDGFNRGHYSNPAVDRLIEQATASIDETERARLYRDAQRLIADDVPYVSLWAKTNIAVAQPSLRKAHLWSNVLPFVLLLWALTGAFYPAVDLCAGEKERGTMETLLISPAERTEIVIGKFLAAACFGFGTAMWNVLLLLVAVAVAQAFFPYSLLSLPGLAACVVAAIPLAMLFAAALTTRRRRRV